MGWEETWRRAISGERGTFLALLRFFLCLLTPLYALGFLIFRALQERRKLRPPCKVIGVGNITLGGTGKTPLTIELARSLKGKGYRVAVICTGYGGRGKAGKAEGRSIEEIGDEAFLITNSLPGISVWIGRDRIKSIEQAVEEGAAVVVLDDALQYFRVEKDLEIVLLNALNPFGYGRLFPRGALRESLKGLARGDVIILSNAGLAKDKKGIKEMIYRYNKKALVLEADYEPDRLEDIIEGKEIGLDYLWGRKVMGVAGIGNPEGFRRTLEKLSGEVVFRSYPDHYLYKEQDLEEILKEAEGKGCEAVVMTPKDGVKMGRLLGSRTSPLPLLVLRSSFRIKNENLLWERVNALFP